MLSSLFNNKNTKSKYSKKFVKKNSNKLKEVALKQFKQNLNNSIITDTSQSYKNKYFNFNESCSLKSKTTSYCQKPHPFIQRPYTNKEKTNIMKTMQSKSINNIYKAGLIERLDTIDKFVGTQEHNNSINSKMKNLSSLIPKNKRTILVETLLKFIKDKKLVLYGGMAINQYVDRRFNLYPTESSNIMINMDSIFPDFDVFSVDAFNDAKEFINILKKKGFSKLSIKRAKHDDTWKISVNHFQIADFTIPDSPVPYKIFKGIRYATIDFLKAALYKASSDPSGGYFRWKKDALRLEKLLHAEEQHIRKHGKFFTHFSKKSKYQRFTSEFYGPLSKGSFKSSGNKKWNDKKRENDMKKKIESQTGNSIQIGKKKIILKEPKILQILNIPKNGSYVPWVNNKASYKLN